MKEILMINMASFEEHHNKSKEFNPPLGILSIATFLELHGHECLVIDYCNEEIDLHKLTDIITSKQIKIITFSVYTINIDEALKFAKFLKKTLSGITIVFGGPHASLDSSYCYNSRYVDYVLKGEGESSVLELVEAIQTGFQLIKPHDIEGLCYVKGKEVMEGSFKEPIKDLDLLPIVKREIVGIENYLDIINISSSRGCPANCIYCAGSELAGKRYRIRNIENVILEIAYVQNQFGNKIRLIYFIDDTFTVMKKRVLYYLELRSKFNFQYKWRCESRIDIIDEELIDAISKNGCLAIHFGIESGSQEVLNKIQKKINLASAKEKIVYTTGKGMLVCCYFMLGHYCDTKETMQETCDLIKELVQKCDIDATLHYNTPYPGTYQYQYRKQLGIRLTSENYRDFVGYRPLIETDNFSVKDQREFYYSVSEYINLHEFKV